VQNIRVILKKWTTKFIPHQHRKPTNKIAPMAAQEKCTYTAPPVSMENLNVVGQFSHLNLTAFSGALIANCGALLIEAEKAKQVACFALDLFLPIFARMAKDAARGGQRKFTINLTQKNTLYEDVKERHPDVEPDLWIPVMFELLKNGVQHHFLVQSGTWAEGLIQCIVTIQA
jgi:hypothetical protein